jgi:hypothetical protein
MVLEQIFFFPLLIFIPPLLHTRHHPVCSNPDQAAHYHILGLYFWGCISDPAHGWLQIKELSLYEVFLALLDKLS